MMPQITRMSILIDDTVLPIKPSTFRDISRNAIMILFNKAILSLPPMQAYAHVADATGLTVKRIQRVVSDMNNSRAN